MSYFLNVSGSELLQTFSARDRKWHPKKLHKEGFHTGSDLDLEPVLFWILKTLVLSSKPAHVNTNLRGKKVGGHYPVSHAKVN